MRFISADVDDSGAGVNASRKFESSFVESEVVGTVIVVVVVEEMSTDSVDKIFGELILFSLIVFYIREKNFYTPNMTITR